MSDHFQASGPEFITMKKTSAVPMTQPLTAQDVLDPTSIDLENGECPSNKALAVVDGGETSNNHWLRRTFWTFLSFVQTVCMRLWNAIASFIRRDDDENESAPPEEPNSEDLSETLKSYIAMRYKQLRAQELSAGTAPYVDINACNSIRSLLAEIFSSCGQIACECHALYRYPVHVGIPTPASGAPLFSEIAKLNEKAEDLRRLLRSVTNALETNLEGTTSDASKPPVPTPRRLRPQAPQASVDNAEKESHPIPAPRYSKLNLGAEKVSGVVAGSSNEKDFVQLQ